MKGPGHVFTRGNEASAWARMIKRGGRMLTQENVVDSNLGLIYQPGYGRAVVNNLRAEDIKGRRSQLLQRVY